MTDKDDARPGAEQDQANKAPDNAATEHAAAEARERRRAALSTALCDEADNWGQDFHGSFLNDLVNAVLAVVDEECAALLASFGLEYAARWREPEAASTWHTTWGFATPEGARNHLATAVGMPAGVVLQRLVGLWEQLEQPAEDEGPGA